MKLLLIGGNGQVGHALHNVLQDWGEIIVTTRAGVLPDGQSCEVLDLAEPGATDALIRRVEPDWIINATAYTAVDKAEADADAAHRINADAIAEIGKAAKDIGIPVVHYSTDYVFNGQGKSPYLPDAATAPLGVYGASKLAGEKALQASGCSHVILRTAWVYGLHGNNFLKTMLRVGAERDQLRVVVDQIGSPTPAWWIAEATRRITEQGFEGQATHHLVTDSQTSWHGFAQAIFEEAVKRGLLARAPTVEAITTAEYPTAAKRPAYSVLDTNSLQKAFGIVPPHWRAGLDATFDRGIFHG